MFYNLNVLKDINAGVLMSPGGEKLAFDPLDKDGKNRDKILDAMVIYMNQEKPNIVMNIATMRSEAEGHNDKIDSAVKNLDAKYTKGLKKYYEENVQTESISFSISFVEPSITLKKSKYFEETQTSGRSGQNDKYAKAKEVIPPPAVGESRKDLTKRLSRGPKKSTFSWEELDRYKGYY